MKNITAWMVKDVVTVEPNSSVSDAASLMSKNKVNSVVVVSNQTPVGIFTERDLLIKVISQGKDPAKTLVSEAMSSDVKAIDSSCGFKEVYDLMRANNIRHLPIVENANLLGVVSLSDLLHFHLKTLEQTVVELTDKLNFARDMLAKSSDERNRDLYLENEKLQGMVIVDGLTGLYNYRYFEETIVNELSRAKRYNRYLTILFLDIDFFKHYNDTNGHEQGNVVLKQLSNILRTTSRQADVVFKSVTGLDIITRYGGEEFVIILPETNRKGGFVRAERILSDVRSFPFYNREAQPSGKLTVSMGVAEFPADAQNSADLVKIADEALYRAKSSGRDKAL